jgi:hypothetical protein
MLPDEPHREWYLLPEEELRELRYRIYQWQQEEGAWAQKDERQRALSLLTKIVSEEARRRAVAELF